MALLSFNTYSLEMDSVSYVWTCLTANTERGTILAVGLCGAINIGWLEGRLPSDVGGEPFSEVRLI